jgi:hypothetical protein
MTGAELLRAYLEDDSQGKRGPTWLAPRLACSPDAIWHWISGRRSPELRLALALEQVTGGAVPAASWVPAPVDGGDPAVAT